MRSATTGTSSTWSGSRCSRSCTWCGELDGDRIGHERRRRMTRQARLLAWVLRIGLIGAIVGQVAWSFRPAPSHAQTEQEALGRQLYENACVTCHGIDGSGTELGPSLEGVGTASVDFYLSSGRMPLANPGDQPQRRPPLYSEEEIAAFVAYLRPV